METEPPTRVEVSSLEAWNHPWRTRPDPCRRSCQRASCRRRPGPCNRSGPCRRAWGGPSGICSHHTGDCRRDAGCRFRVTGDRLSIETGSGAAEEAGECCGQCEVAYGVGLHEEFLSSVGPGVPPGGLGSDPEAGKSAI